MCFRVRNNQILQVPLNDLDSKVTGRKCPFKRRPAEPNEHPELSEVQLKPEGNLLLNAAAAAAADRM